MPSQEYLDKMADLDRQRQELAHDRRVVGCALLLCVIGMMVGSVLKLLALL